MERATTPPLPACLTDEQVTALVEGLASPEEREQFEIHIAECSACAALAAAVSATSTASGARDRSPPDLLPPGARIGRYQIVGCLGAGAMGTVYDAHDPALDRRIALKLIRAQVAGPDLEVRLLREAKAMARLVHPGVITVHDAGRDGDRLFIAMELVDGGTLRQWLQERPRTWREIVDVYLRSGEGLAQAHASGLVHRDFKPDNVLIGKDGRVRVTDFGLAREAGAGEAPSEPSDDAVPLENTMNVQLTRTGAIVGTPVYMAPEQLSGIATDARSDLYSFCVALYEALYGSRPFVSKTLTAQKKEKQSDVLPPPARSVPTRVRRVLAGGLRARPEDRFASMRTLLDALERAARWPLVAPERPLLWVGASLAVLALGGGAAWRNRAPPVTANAATASTQAIVTALAGPDARLACPIFETRGVSDVGVRLGAAAAMLVCGREVWQLGGQDERVLTPAALLDVPTQPADGFPDPYAGPSPRERTVAIAKARAVAYVDGQVTSDSSAWSVELVLRAPDDREVTRARASNANFTTAVRSAAIGLWAPPLARRPIDPDVARWTSYGDADFGAVEADLNMFANTAGCESAETHATGTVRLFLSKKCELFDATPLPFDGGVPALDESSPEALVASTRTLQVWRLFPSIDQVRRAVPKLEQAKRGESRFAQARLDLTAGLLWSGANEPERARAALLQALREAPLLYDAWEIIVRPNGALLDPSAASVASAWFPAEAVFLSKASSWRGDELDVRLRDSRLAFVLDPRLPQALHLVRALAELGRADDARAVGAASFDGPEENREVNEYVLGFVALHEAKLVRAITHLEKAGNAAMPDLVVAADVAGRSSEVATRWSKSFLSLPDAEAGPTARGYHAPMVLCMRASGSVANRCLDRVEQLGRSGRNWWYEGGTALLQGARRYAAGDVRGAVSSWRPLVAGDNLEVVRLLPTEAFELAGEHDLATRLDTRKMPFTFIAGVSDAAPREAARAAKRGDGDRARELARAVVQAWEVADVDVPSVARMRSLLGALDR